MARPLLRSFDASRFEVRVEDMAQIPDGRQIVLVATDEPITAEQASQLRDFVSAGGGLVLLHGTLAAWSSSDAIRELAGWVPSGPGPLTVMIVRTNPVHSVKRRADAEWEVLVVLLLSEEPPLFANVSFAAGRRCSYHAIVNE